MLRLGMLDFDTSHVVAFTKRLNHVDIDEEQWVDGARVSIACPGASQVMPQRITANVRAMTKLGVPLVDDPLQMIGQVDGMLIESQQGSLHCERARPFLEAGIPCFIDKPITTGIDDARRIADLSHKHNAPAFSSSALRYAPELVQYVADEERGALVGALVYGPMSLHECNPGLFHYGIHATEALYALMGPGCERVSALHHDDVDAVTAQWRDGRTASLRGIRKGHADYGFTAFSERRISNVTMSPRMIYRELLCKIIEHFDTRIAPVPLETTLEIVSFIDAANSSAANRGAPVYLNRT